MVEEEEEIGDEIAINHDDDKIVTATTVKKEQPLLIFRNYVPLDDALLLKSRQPPNTRLFDSNEYPSENHHDDEDNDNGISSPNPKRSRTTTNAVNNTRATTKTPPQKSPLELALERERLDQLNHQKEKEISSTAAINKDMEHIVSNRRKVNWDLKRDIQHQINKLEKRTQRALLDILKQRILSSQQPQQQPNNDLD